MARTMEPAGKVPSSLSQVTLEEMLAGSKLPRRPVVTLEHNLALSTALKKLAAENILSAPVVLAASIEDTDSGNYLGILDVMDILRFIIKQIAPKTVGKTGEKKWQALYDGSKELLAYKLIQICGHDTGFGYTNYLQRSVLDLIREGFVRADGSRAHRIAISDGHVGFVRIVTQSDAVQYLAHHPETVKGLLNLSIEELGLVTKKDKVVVVSQNIQTMDAFEAMVKHGVSSVGLVDEQGTLVGNLSASDLRGMDVTDFTLLMSPVKRFLEIEKGTWARKYLISVDHDSTFGDILKVLKSWRVHRVYVRNENGRPLGIITLSDLLAVVLEHCDRSPRSADPAKQ